MTISYSLLFIVSFNLFSIIYELLCELIHIKIDRNKIN